MSDFLCGERCWTPTACPECGGALGPRGRSLPLEMSYSSCCEDARQDASNHRHLWDEHDSTRFYTDPFGWLKHTESCERCR
jgi:hypothetical protein